MNEVLLVPPLAFGIYVLLAGALWAGGRLLAGPDRPSGIYASGEASKTSGAVPGYRTFFAVALFFAILHLGALLIGGGTFTPTVAVFLVGLALVLLALMVG